MREGLKRLGGARRARAGVAVVAAAILLTAVWNASVAIERMGDAREEYGPLSSAERENQIEQALGFDSAVWDGIRRAVSPDDRFFVVSDAFEQHEVRNYAAYALLPAIQVSDPEEATVVLHWASRPPPGAACERVGASVCVERRGRA